MSDAVDSTSFSQFGIVLLDDPPKVTFKEVHLDAGNLLGKNAIVDGQVEGIGKHLTHFILRDETARMLVVLTKTWNDLSESDFAHGDRVAIYGLVERGQKGLPYIEAKAVYLVFRGYGLKQ